MTQFGIGVIVGIAGVILAEGAVAMILWWLTRAKR